MTKKLLAAIVAVIMLASLSGCNMVIKDEAKDAQTVVAEVNGETVLKSEIMSDYELYKSFYGLTDANENDADKAESKNNLIDTLLDKRVNNILFKQKAEELGVSELSEEQQKSLEEQMAQIKEYISSSVESAVAARAETDPTIDKEALTAEFMAQYEKDYGISNGVYEADLISSMLQNNIKDHLNKDLSISDSEVQSWYDENLKIQQDAITADVTSYATYAPGIVVYKPELHYVKNLLIALDADTKAKIKTLEGAEDTAEEGKALREQEEAKLKTTADEVYQKAIDGADFDALIEQYGGDTGMESEPYKTEGYEVFAGKATFDSVFTEAAMALKNVGDISKPTYSADYGYYILQMIKKTEEGAVPLAEISEDIKNQLYDNKATEVFNKALEEWKAADGVKTYRERI